jgi:ATP-dependent Lhr-like helicase
VRWPSEPIVESFQLVRAQREVLLGATPDVDLSRRAVDRLSRVRADQASDVDPAGLVLRATPAGSQLWTWAGWRANETLIAALAVNATSDNAVIRLPPEVGVAELRRAVVSSVLPFVSPQAVDGLKFSAALPPEMARTTLAERNLDREGAFDVVGQRIVVRAGDDHGV